jgi:hypothetical protein
LPRRAHRRIRTALAAAGLSLTVLLALPGVAQAGQLLTPYTVFTGPTPTSTKWYDFTTTTPYWSVVALRPPVNADYDQVLTDWSGNRLGASSLGTGELDFVAIDSNLRPLGNYSSEVHPYAGSGGYGVELAQGSQVVSANLPPSGGFPVALQPIPLYGGFLAVRDVYLTAGTRYIVYLFSYGDNVTRGGYLSVMASDPSAPGTWIVGRSGAAATCGWDQRQGHIDNFKCYVLYTPPRTAWYGLVMINPYSNGDVSVGISPF